MARLKRIIPLLLALALVVPVLLIAAPVTVRAATSNYIVDVKSSGSTSYNGGTNWGGYYGKTAIAGQGEDYFNLLYYLDESKVWLMGFYDENQFLGLFWQNDILYYGCFNNPSGTIDSSLLGLKDISDYYCTVSGPMSYFRRSTPFSSSDYSTKYYVGVYRGSADVSNYPDAIKLCSYTEYNSWVSLLGSVDGVNYYFLLARSSGCMSYSTLTFVYGDSDPTTPTLETSLNATQRIPYGESINLFVLADNVNGDVTIDWYVNGALSESFDMYSVGSGNQAIGAWKFTPGSSGAYFVYAVVTNTVGDSSVSVTSITGHLIFYDSSGDDSGSTSSTDPTTDTSSDDDTELGTSAKLEEIETSLDEVKDAVASVDDKLDGVSDQLDGVSDQLDGVSDQLEESNSWLSNIADGITSLPEKIMDGIKGLFVPDEEAIAEQQDKWNQLFADRFGVVYESVEIVDNLAGAFTNDGTTDLIEFPTVTVPLGEIDWTFGGWEVDVVPDGFEFLIEVLKKIIDILCTLAFVNSLRKRYESLIGH